MQILDFAKEPRAVLELSHRRWKLGQEVLSRVQEILQSVEEDGDEAVTTLTRQLDCKFIDSLGLRVTDRERESAYQGVSKQFVRALRTAQANITAFHKKQVLKSWTLERSGMTLQQRVMPLRRVGIYVPGGKAAYPSTVMMNALPARIAGVQEVVMATPCNAEGKISPEVLVAANECGVNEIFRIGGAQAIGAFAYGTESIRRVDKITGPGNAYVAAAKRLVFGRVGIDVIAGPTEVLVIADATAPPSFVAADLIAQAEHDEDASPLCITDTRSHAESVQGEVQRQLESAPRRVVARQALENHGAIILVETMDQAVSITNELAPEHVEIITRNPGRMAGKITNAGSVFVGPWSTEALGDYIAGPNHTLPTSGTARFSSALSVYDFMKFVNVIGFTRRGFMKVAGHVEVLAEAEGLAGHAYSVKIRKGPR